MRFFYSSLALCFLSKSTRFQKNGHIIHFVDCFCNQIAKVHFFPFWLILSSKRRKMMGFFSFPSRFIAYVCIDNMPSPIASHAERQSELIDRQENDYL
jgi:hypothetical protein